MNGPCRQQRRGTYVCGWSNGSDLFQRGISKLLCSGILATAEIDTENNNKLLLLLRPLSLGNGSHV